MVASRGSVDVMKIMLIIRKLSDSGKEIYSHALSVPFCW